MNGVIVARPAAFTLCADDFAISPGVSRAILELVDAGRLTAAGAMTNRPFWPEGAKALRGFQGQAEFGLHLNLTAGAPLTALMGLAAGGALPPAAEVFKAALLGRLPLDAVRAEIAAQLDAFEQHMGRAPDFVDGHQHVHALPGVRVALLQELIRRYSGEKPWLRDPSDSIAAIAKRRFSAAKAYQVKALAYGFGAMARRAGFETNDSFAGFSAFDPARSFAPDFATYLLAPGSRHLVMCHPGYIDDELRRIDRVLETREMERAFFEGDGFLKAVEGIDEFSGLAASAGARRPGT